MPRKGRKYPYLPWWLYDYRSDPLVQAMSDDQDLAYRRMIEVSWDLGELENNPGKIAALIRFSPRKFSSVWKYPLTECWQNNGTGLVNARLEREWEKVDASYRQKKRAGEASGQARKKATGVERTLNGCSTDDGQTLNDPDPDPDPDPKKNKKKKNKREAEASPLVPTGVVFSKVTKKLEMIPAYMTWLREQVELQGIELDQRDGPKGIRLTDEELQDGTKRLEDHLLVNQQRTAAKALPFRVRNWLCEDLRRKWERLKNRGVSSQKSPLQQTLETIARMNKEDRESGK